MKQTALLSQFIGLKPKSPFCSSVAPVTTCPVTWTELSVRTVYGHSGGNIVHLWCAKKAPNAPKKKRRPKNPIEKDTSKSCGWNLLLLFHLQRLGLSRNVPTLSPFTECVRSRLPAPDTTVCADNTDDASLLACHTRGDTNIDHRSIGLVRFEHGAHKMRIEGDGWRFDGAGASGKCIFDTSAVRSPQRTGWSLPMRMPHAWYWSRKKPRSECACVHCLEKSTPFCRQQQPANSAGPQTVQAHHHRHWSSCAEFSTFRTVCRTVSNRHR